MKKIFLCDGYGQLAYTYDTRDFTGHEHYDRFHIVNANARLYDPVIGRFFSPDPFVQAPDFTQNYNRYSYCLNNPVMYSDPNGEFVIVDSWIVGFVSKLFETSSLKQSWQEANKRAINDVKIWGGLFAMDPNKNFWGKIGEVVSRFTWQVPQTFVGWLVAESCNTLGFGGGVESVDYKYGATVTRTNNSGWGAVTLSSYITGDNSIRADANNSLFQHEYGHYIQSQATGIFYLPRYGIPSGLNCLGPNKYRHKYHPVEQDANIRAFKYFNDNIDGFNQWDSDRHPINGYVWSLPFTDDNNQNALANGRLRPAWYDYFLIFSPLWDAYINWLVLENY
jgi:RHS repeat-associated protein